MECPEGGKHNVIWESDLGEEHAVCQSCGTVLESGSYAQDHNQFGTAHVSQHHSGRPDQFKGGIKSDSCKTRVYRDGLAIMENMSSLLGLPDDLKKRAKMIYDQVKYLNRPTVAAAAVYIVLKQMGKPVTLRYLSNFVNISYYDIGEVVRTICLKLDLQLKNVVAMKDFAPLVLKDGCFVDPEGVCEKDRVIERTVEIVNLCTENMLLTGADPNFNMIASAFVAWKSLLPRYRKTKRIKEFLDVANIKMTNTANVFAKSKLILKFFVKMSHHLPWNTDPESINEKNILFHIPELLQYKHQLVFSEALDRQEDTAVEKGLGIEDLSVGYMQVYKEGRKRYVQNRMKLEEMKLKVPRTESNPRKETHDLFSCDLTEEDLPENELRRYIRSPEEVKKIAALHSVSE